MAPIIWSAAVLPPLLRTKTKQPGNHSAMRQALLVICRYLGQPILAVLFSLLFLASLSAAQSQEPTPPIRVTVNRVNVGVTVTDSTGHFISGLRREDFHIFDNEVEQPITDFLPIEEPAQLLLLIESGPAVYFLGQGHFRAAETLLTSISPADRVAVAAYSNAPQLILGFTPDKAAARYALQNLNFSLGFAELNLSASVAAMLDWMAPLPGKKTIVLLSTGFDTSPPENCKPPTCASSPFPSPVISANPSKARNEFRRTPPTGIWSTRAFIKQTNPCSNSPQPQAAASISPKTPTNSIAPTPKSPS